jgi:hypothetical protein
MIGKLNNLKNLCAQEKHKQHKQNRERSLISEKNVSPFYIYIAKVMYTPISTIYNGR